MRRSAIRWAARIPRRNLVVVAVRLRLGLLSSRFLSSCLLKCSIELTLRYIWTKHGPVPATVIRSPLLVSYANSYILYTRSLDDGKRIEAQHGLCSS